MLTLRKNSLKYKDENGVMQDSGVLFSSGATEVDETLSKSGMAADAKAVGDEFGKLSEEKADKSYVVSVFEQLKQLIQNGDVESAVAVLDEAILDLSTLA